MQSTDGQTDIQQCCEQSAFIGCYTGVIGKRSQASSYCMNVLFGPSATAPNIKPARYSETLAKLSAITFLGAASTRRAFHTQRSKRRGSKPDLASNRGFQSARKKMLPELKIGANILQCVRAIRRTEKDSRKLPRTDPDNPFWVGSPLGV